MSSENVKKIVEIGFARDKEVHPNAGKVRPERPPMDTKPSSPPSVKPKS